MDRRDLLALLGIETASLAALGVRAAHAAENPDHRDDPQEACVNACKACATKCAETCHECIEQLAAGKKEYAKALQLVSDCEAFCTLSASMISRRSPLMAYSCAACADACRDCAKECDQLGSTTMRECAERCRSCEKACRDMVRAMA